VTRTHQRPHRGPQCTALGQQVAMRQTPAQTKSLLPASQTVQRLCFGKTALLSSLSSLSAQDSVSHQFPEQGPVLPLKNIASNKPARTQGPTQRAMPHGRCTAWRGSTGAMQASMSWAQSTRPQDQGPQVFWSSLCPRCEPTQVSTASVPRTACLLAEILHRNSTKSRTI
jgi:hypothetical protein